MDISAQDRLSQEQVQEVLALIERVTREDGVHPLSEHVWLHLRHGLDERSRHVLAREGDRLMGYAHIDPTDKVAGPSAEIAVDPEHRRHGIGRALLEAVIAQCDGGRLRLWAHGEQTGAGRLARSMGFTRGRVLWQMRRSLHAPIPPIRVPAGFSIRSFETGRDEDAWVAVNNRAFSDHPDQGSWTMADLELRMAEPWFDAAGFFLGVDGSGAIAGFVWTKVHGAGSRHRGDGHRHEAIGEAYIVGVDPAFQGKGLARALMAAALHYLQEQGLSQAMLYVDADQAGAIRLYESLGFTRWDTDVLYRAPRT